MLSKHSDTVGNINTRKRNYSTTCAYASKVAKCGLYTVIVIIWTLFISHQSSQPSRSTLPTITFNVTNETDVVTAAVNSNKSPFDATNNPDNKPFAYAFYATDSQYMCAAVVALQTLLDTNPDPNIEIVLLIPEDQKQYLLTEKNRNFLNRTAETRKLNIHELSVPYRTDNSYYRDVFLKLAVFELYQYHRILIVDADSTITNNLDHLFLLPETPVAAPHATWLEQKHVFITSLLLLIMPTPDNWQRIEQHFSKQYKKFDMDLINQEFVRDMITLPGRYGTLNSFFETSKDSHSAFKKTPENALKDMLVVHYTAKGKPWQSGSDPHWKDQVHPVFLGLHRKWHNISVDVC